MPAARTAAYLVAAVRDELQIFGTAVAYRDGFSADSAVVATPILPRINEAIGELAIATRYCQGSITQALTSTVREYTLDGSITEVLAIYGVAGRLRPTTRDGLSARNPTWYLDAVGVPSQYFIEGTTLTLYPTPGASPASLTIRASIAPGDLVATTDVPTKMPWVFQDKVIYGAALKMTIIDQDNDAHAQRVAFFEKEWQGAIVSLARIVAAQDADFDTPVSMDTYQRRAGLSTQDESGVPLAAAGTPEAA